MGTCSSYPLIRQCFAQMREDVMEDVGIPDNIQKANVDNHEPNADGIYPDCTTKTTSSTIENSKLQNCLSIIAMRRSIGYKTGTL